jgi:hypothetical protein
MSAFVVSEDTINVILTSIVTERSETINYWLGKLGYNVKSKESMSKLGKDLLNMNIEAVDYRYNENSPKVESFEYRMKPLSVYGQLKSLESYLYQCSEGDTPGKPLYGVMQKIEHSFMHSIICGIPEYQSAPWSH